MINPVWLTSFVEVVNFLSMVNAARHLKLTPAAVSKHIMLLEQKLCLPLLKRSTRKVELTEEGELYFEQAKKILEAYEQAEGAISHLKEEPAGKLKILCGPHIGNTHVIPHLGQFMEKYPKIRPYLEVTQTMPDLEKEQVDVIVGLTLGIPAHWIQRTLMPTRWVFCASSEYLAKYGTPKAPSDLQSHRIITRVQRRPNNLIEFKNGESILFDPYLYCNDTRAMRRAALHGLGIVQLHDYIISEDLKQGRLIEILPEYMEQKQTVSVHLSYRPSAQIHSKVRLFIDFIIEITQKNIS
jgi:DNA-binding transcriptional LysR family regulator